MASFAAVSDAVRCAVSVQEALVEHNRQSPKDEVILRIGLHAGEPIEDEVEALYGQPPVLTADAIGPKIGLRSHARLRFPLAHVMEARRSASVLRWARTFRMPLSRVRRL